MSNPEHLEILKQGVEAWNQWRDEHREVRPDLSELNLDGMNLRGADLSDANLWLTDFPKANLSESKLSRSNLLLGNLAGANLAHAEIVETKLYNADLSGARLDGANLGKSNLRGAKLIGASLDATDLRLADLVGAGLSRARIRRCNLSGAKLEFTHFCEAELLDTDVQGADLFMADFFRTNLCRVNFSGASFRGVRINETRFAEVDLSTAKGLELAKHEGPSTIGIDTICASRGKIPEVFLRGCGVPEEFVACIGSTVGKPIESCSCYISYLRADDEFASRLHSDLRASGVRCWLAQRESKGGQVFPARREYVLRPQDKLVLILSEDSMRTEWIKTEIATARKREVKEDKRVLFPVRLVGFDWECFDGDTGKDSAREIREYFIPDFSNWKDHDSYQTAFQRLVSDLKAEASG